MSRKRLAATFTPWRAERSRSWENAFRYGPPPVDDPDQIDKWHGARDRAEKNAEWLVWGANLMEPCLAQTLAGAPAYFDDQRIVAHIPPLVTDRPDADHGALAKRIAECVNACAGIIDPATAIAEAQTLLLDLVQGKINADDSRVLRVMVLIHPADQTPQKCISGEPP